jgi:hypothetical protein
MLFVSLVELGDGDFEIAVKAHKRGADAVLRRRADIDGDRPIYEDEISLPGRMLHGLS